MGRFMPRVYTGQPGRGAYRTLRRYPSMPCTELVLPAYCATRDGDQSNSTCASARPGPIRYVAPKAVARRVVTPESSKRPRFRGSVVLTLWDCKPAPTEACTSSARKTSWLPRIPNCTSHACVFDLSDRAGAPEY